jgi:proline iminopeptidase
MLRSFSLFTKTHVDWFLYDMRKVFPEVWERFTKGHDKDNLLKSYADKLAANDIESALQWVDYEGSCSTLYPQFRTITSDKERQAALSLAKIECHYYQNHVFKNDTFLLSKIDAFRHVPGVIIHGRYDMITPIESAYRLHKQWPESDFIIVPDGGHSALDPAIQDRILMMTDNARSIR